ncbi:MAG TPA: nucleobase:cation symporter-2 family protein [Soehngenia sp.]|nr:nucleobase:cation symporter-2 family protein [Soehngenia sp.]
MSVYEYTTYNTGLEYDVYDKPSVGKSIVLGIQNILTSFGGIVAVPLSIAGIAGLSIVDTAYIVSAALLASGVASIMQSKGFGPKNYRVGIGLPTVMGTDFGFVPAANVVINSMGGGLPAYFGGAILGGILEFILSHFVEPLMKIFTPIITGTVITLMGLSMMPVAFDWIGGGFGNPNYGDPIYLIIAVTVLLVVLFLNRYGKGMASSAAVLIGMVVGYIISIPFGLVDFSKVAEAYWFKLPEIGRFGIDFNIKYSIPFIAGYLVTIIETVGVMQTLGEVTYTELTGKDMAAGVRADALGSMVGPLLGSGPVQSFSQNVGLIPLTKCGSRFVAIITGILLIVISFCPKFATIISIMPECVLGGASIVMFGTVAVSGIKTISKVRYTNRNMLIVASALGIGLGVTFRPAILEQLPGVLSSLFSSGLSAGTVVALVLSAILKEEEESKPELE